MKSLRPIARFEKNLSQIAEFLHLEKPDIDAKVNGLTLNTASLESNDLFIALKGEKSHGASFWNPTLSAAVLTDREGAALIPSQTPLVVGEKIRDSIGDLSSWFYNKPFNSMFNVGITGTNGKTTTATLLNQIWKSQNRVSGFIGTTGIEIAGEIFATSFTTPEAPELQAIAASMVERHVTHTVMEVSSHSIVQKRINGARFNIAAFTNLSQDHLDFHKTMDEYFEAKARLFTTEYSDLGFINIDNPYGAKLYERASIPMIAVSRLNKKAIWHYTSIEAARGGYQVSLRGAGGVLIEGFLPLIGGHNLDNALMAIAIAVESGVDPLAISAHLAELRGPAGRLEKVSLGQNFLALVDYAHSPDAVERVLAAVREITPGKIIAVLGCGGDRDVSKRPLMGRALSQGSDLAVMTSDNPRSEDPEKILSEMQGEMKPSENLVIELDRRGAIAIAVSEAGLGDTVIVLGKGHELGQEINGIKYPFDDRIELARAIESLS